MSTNPPSAPGAATPSNEPTPPPAYAATAPTTPYDQQPYGQPQQPAPYGQQPAPVAEKKRRNILGIIALVVSAVGFIFGCIPGALIVGWILLPIAFVLGIVSLFQKGKVKWQGVTAIIVSIVGTIVAAIVFTAVVATAFTDAFGSSDVEVGDAPAVVEEEAAPAEEEAEAPAAEAGTRENPLPLGTPFSSDEWTVVVNSVTLGATDQIVNENMMNEAPDPGSEYILINYTLTYIGNDAEGGMPAFVGMEYVTAAGVTVDPFDKLVVAPDSMDTLSALYNGASATGNNAIQVPSPADGVLAFRPGMMVDKVFVAIQ